MENSKKNINIATRFEIETDNAFTGKFKKVAPSSIDNKILQRLDGIMSYSYGKGAGRECKIQLTKYIKMKN